MDNEKKTISVKFNKEKKEISLEEAVLLAQKGLKFDAVAPTLERLKTLAEREAKSVSEYIAALEKEATLKKVQSLVDSCADKDTLLEAIANYSAEKKPNTAGFDELKAAYPQFDDISKVPEEVVENAYLYGRNLFDQYLRYEFSKKQLEKKLNETLAENLSIGSQSKKDNGRFDPISARFLKGLWGN